MIFEFFIVFSWCAVFGIDLGDCYTKVSTASQRHLVLQAMNSYSKFLNPTIISIWNTSNPKHAQSYDEKHALDYNWGVADIVRMRCLRYPETCIRGIPILQNSTFAGDDIETFSAIYLKSIFESVNHAEDLHESVQNVISIPHSFGTSEKLLLQKAVSLTNLSVTKFVYHQSAIAKLYGIERSNTFADKELYTAFVDIGSKGTRISIYKFNSDNQSINIEEIAFAANENVGGNAIDQKLIDKIVKNHKIKFSKPKHYYFLLDEVKKAKEMLTLHDKQTFKFEQEENKPIMITITRNDLKEASKELIDVINQLSDKVLKECPVKVNTVEFVGGSTRLFFLPDIIKPKFDVDRISHSLNADAAISMGATYFAAILFSEFSVKKVNFTEKIRNSFEIRVRDKEYKIFGEGTTQRTVPHIRCRITKKDLIKISSNGSDFLGFTVDVPEEMVVDLSFVMGHYLLPIPFKAVSGEGKEFEISIIKHKVDRKRYDSLIRSAVIRKMREKARNDLETQLFKVKNFLEKNKNQKIENAYKKVTEWLETVDQRTSANTINRVLQSLNNETLGLMNFIDPTHDRTI